MSKITIALCAALLGCALISSAQAAWHEEERHKGKLQFNVGWDLIRPTPVRTSFFF
jgi:hypothetical protein